MTLVTRKFIRLKQLFKKLRFKELIYFYLFVIIKLYFILSQIQICMIKGPYLLRDCLFAREKIMA